MIERRRLRFRLLLAVLAIPATLSMGCMRLTSTLELTSYRDTYFAETYTIDLTQCAYSVDSGGDHHIVGRAIHASDEGNDAAIEQLLHVHLFWKPLPGKTFDNPSTVDATIRYAIVTERGTAVYTGTAFVYPKQRRWSDDLIISIEDARLRLDSRNGDPLRLFDRARLVGKLVAKRDPALTVDVRRQLDLRSGSREPR